ncbi:MAG: riboflavin synthase [Chitinivibrionales bacterium]|nr:riboflavin synthase [Chitinivibrionales bacterium]
MFTGLIETTGTICSRRRSACGLLLEIRPDSQPFEVGAGDSVAVNGACLTVEKFSPDAITFTAVQETVERTCLDRLASGEKVNLERSLRLQDRLDGHVVLGHVDCTGTISTDRKVGSSLLRTIALPVEYMKFAAEKGSIAVDGVSLTIASNVENAITLSLVPYTLEHTNIFSKRPGDTVNIECDILARYIFQLVKAGFGDANHSRSQAGSLLDKLEKFGF